MAIMKVWDGKQTHYIFHPENIVEVFDTTDGVGVEPRESGTIRIVTEKSARLVKREIQENTDEPIGYLKMTDHGEVKNGRRYVNVKYLVGAKPKKVRAYDAEGKDLGIVDGAQVTVEHQGRSGVIYVDMTPFDVALQVRRILRRLDQDEDICCATETPAEEEAE